MNKTWWFSADVKPIHVGLYECHRREFGEMTTRMLHWNGGFWEFVDGDTPYACKPGCYAAMEATDDDKWRGLTERA